MKRRRAILGVLAALGVAAAAVVVTLLALEPAPGVTEANAKRLRFGMSRARFEAIMGGPGELSRTQVLPSDRYEWRGDRVTVVCGSATGDMLWQASVVDADDESRGVELDFTTTYQRVLGWLGL